MPIFQSWPNNQPEKEEN